MTGLLSLFKRSLREHSRSPALIAARVGLALALIGCLVLFGSWEWMVGAAGLSFFTAVIWVNAVFITAGGCTYFASAISEEKEDGTLMLLRMTRISPLALLIGKGGARLVDGLLLLAVQIPFTLIGITLGGITWDQVSAAYLSLGAFLVLLCTIGLLAGVLMSGPAKAAIFSALCIWVVLYGGDMASVVNGGPFVAILRSLDIFTRLGEITQTNFSGPAFASQVQWSLSVSVGLFGAAWLLFNRFCSDTTPQSGGVHGRWEFLRRPSGEMRAPDTGLVRWKDVHFLHGGSIATAWKLVLYGLLTVWFGLMVMARPGNVMDRIALWGVCVATCGFVGMGAELLIGTSRMFRVEQRDRTLGTLYTLPHASAETLFQLKSAALWRTLGSATVCTIIGCCIILCAGIFDGRSTGNQFSMMALGAGPGVLAVGFPLFWAHALFIQRLVLYLSLTIRSGSVALAIAIWVLGTLVIWLCWWAIFTVIDIDPILILLAALVLAVVPSVIAAAWLKRRCIALIQRVAEQE